MNTTPGVLTQNHAQLKLIMTPKNEWKIVGQTNYMVVITAIFDGFERRKSPLLRCPDPVEGEGYYQAMLRVLCVVC